MFIILLYYLLKFLRKQKLKVLISDKNSFIHRANIILLNQNDDIETFVFSNKDGSFSFYRKNRFYKL